MKKYTQFKLLFVVMLFNVCIINSLYAFNYEYLEQNFINISKAPGVEVWQMNDRNDVFLQIVHLDKGAKIIQQTGEIVSSSENPPVFDYNHDTTHWNELKTEYPNLFSMTSGTFGGNFVDVDNVYINYIEFYSKLTGILLEYLWNKFPQRGEIIYPIKDKYVINYGRYEETKYPKKMLQVWDGKAKISVYPETNKDPSIDVKIIEDSDANIIIVGLDRNDPIAKGKDNKSTGRTFYGVVDEVKVITFSTSNMTTGEVNNIFDQLSVNDVIQFDGSGSTKFISYEENMKETIRLTPNDPRLIGQVIGILKGNLSYELKIMNESATPQTINSGQSVTAEYDISLTENDGDAEYEIMLNFYLSKDKTYDEPDNFLGNSVNKVDNKTCFHYEKVLTIPSSIDTGQWHILFVPYISDHLDDIITEFNIGNTIITVDEIPDSVQEISDIIISDFAITSSTNDNNTIATTTEISNYGVSAANNNFLIYYYLSENSVFENSDMYLGYENLNALPAKESKEISKSLSIPDNLMSGDFYLIAVSDATNQIEELNEGNNEKSLLFSNNSISNSFPDIAITYPYVTPAISEPGSTIKAVATIQNQGERSTEKNFILRFYLSKDRTLDDTDESLSVMSVPPLDTGITVERENELTLPTDLQSDSYYILFEADTHKVIEESNENNNINYAPFVVKKNDPVFTDLLLEIAEIRPSIIKLGEYKTQIRIRVRNIGNNQSDECTISYYLSQDESLDDHDTLLEQDTISTLYPNFTNIKETDITLPDSLGEGNYYIIFSLDNGNSISESNEMNNIVAKIFKIKDYVSGGEPGTFSDLIIVNVTFDKTTAHPGENIQVTFSIKNNGDLGTVSTSRVGYYLSTNGDSWDNDDIMLSTNYFGSILPGDTVAIERTITLPSNLQYGEKHLILYADYQERVAENNNNNNFYSKAVTISYNKELTVFIPNSDTNWARNRKHAITWASNLGGDVNIELYKSLTLEMLIASDAPNTGSFIWNIPDDLYPGDIYRIKIISNLDASKYDFSDYFYIGYEDFITVLEPEAGAEFGFNTNRIIKWETTAFGGVNNVNILLYKDNVFHMVIEKLVETVKTAPTFYDWKVSDDIPTGDNYTIKLVNSTDDETYGFSGQFSIKKSGLVAEITIDDIASTQINEAVQINVLSNDNLGATIPISSITQPENGSASIHSDKQSITYTPDNNFIGTDFFTYSIISNSQTYSAYVYVDVNEQSEKSSIWLKSAGGQSKDSVKGIAVDYNGNVYITGDYNDTTFDNYTLSGKGIFMAKYNSSGNFEWAQKIETGSYGTATDIDVDNVGNLYVIGDFSSYVSFYEDNTMKNQFNAVNGSEIFFVKYNPLGKIIWANVATGAYDDKSSSIAVNKTNGEFSITGSFNDDLTFGSGTSSTSLSVADSRLHTFIAKYNKDAVPIWAKKVDGSYSNSSYGIAMTNSGDVVVTGYFNESATFYGSPNINLSNNGNDTFYLAKLNSSNGNVTWVQKAEGKYSNDGRSVITDTDENIFVLGKFESNLQLYYGNTLIKSLTAKSSASDVFVAKYNGSGQLQWTQQAGGISYDYGFDISLTNNNPVATGYFSYQADFGSGDDIIQMESKGSTDAFAWILDNATGSNIKAVPLGGSGSEMGHGIEGDSDGTIYFTGDYSNSLTFDSDNQELKISSINNSSDIFIMKLAEIEPAPQQFPPIAVKDNAFTLINNSIKVAVLENDSDLDGDQINILSFKQPVNGNVSMNTGDMFISYFPDEDFTGIDTFEYTIIDDNQETSTTEVNIFVFDINEAPVLNKIPNQTIHIEGYFKTVDLNHYVSDDTTPDESIKWRIEGATNLSININNGIATISPNNLNWTGSETITFIAKDESGSSQNSKATFSINPLFNETPTIIQINDQSIQKGESFKSISLDYHVIDDHTLNKNIQWSTICGNNLSVELKDRTASIIVNNQNWVGSENVTFIAKDDGNLANSQVVTFSVVPQDHKQGDINNDERINLTDLLLTLKILTESEINQFFEIKSDVNDDDKIGAEEMIYIIRQVSGN